MALFDRSAVDYDDWCQTPLGSFVDELEKNLVKKISLPKKGEQALDLGCGTGIYSYWLMEQGLEVKGIDISTEMLKIARDKGGTENSSFIQGDIHSLPFSDDTFDLIVSNITLEFVDDPKQVVAEAIRTLKPGGRLVCGFIGKYSSWGKVYQERGIKDKMSTFSRATFFTHNDIKRLNNEISPNEMNNGLFLGMNEFISYEQAKELEKEKEITCSNDEAGFIVARWVKE